MILVQCILEWAVVCGGAIFLVVGIRIVEVVLIAIVLLLAIDAPYRNSNTSKQDSTSNATNHTTNYTLGRTAQARAAATATATTQCCACCYCLNSRRCSCSCAYYTIASGNEGGCDGSCGA